MVVGDEVAQKSVRLSPVLWSRCATLPGQYVVFLGKKNLILLSSLHPGIKMGAGELSGKLDDMFGGRGEGGGGTLRSTGIPSSGE